MSLYKRAFVRGVNDELIRLGYARYPSKTAADEVADAVGDQIPVEPEAQEVPPAVAADVATTLVDAANTLVEATGANANPDVVEEAAKESAAADIDTRAHNQAYAVMVKSAQQSKMAMGSTIEGGDKGNDMAQAIQAETVMENKNRPEGAYVAGVGNTAFPVGVGNVGTETVGTPNISGSPHNTPAGTNSLIEQSQKQGSLQAVIQKIAAGMGSTIEGGDKGNTLAQAGAVTGEGKIEAQRRPEGYAVAGVGNTQFPVGKGVIGSEQAHPDQPNQTPGGAAGNGGNSVVEWSGANADGSTKNAYISLFRDTAEKTANYLPVHMTEEVKIAHIRRMMGMNDIERGQYLQSVVG